MSGIALGIGFTNACNYKCSHCYSRNQGTAFLPLKRFRYLCDNLPIQSINFGTGESYLHPDFEKAVEYAHGKGIKLSVTSNGYTIRMLDDAHLTMFNDIDLSLDFTDPKRHDDFRGAGASSDVLRGVERCDALGVEASLVTAMMKENCRQIDRVSRLARSLGVNLRINTYKPVNTDKHKLTYEEFWTGIKLLLESASLISCSEPVVNVLLGNKTLDGGFPCGKQSLRINPNGGVVPCVYWKDAKCSLEDVVDMYRQSSNGGFAKAIAKLSEESRAIPEECADCAHVDVCKGGCAATRHYNDPRKPDPYCFVLKGDKPDIKWTWAKSKSLVHSSYLCTIIVE